MVHARYVSYSNVISASESELQQKQVDCVLSYQATTSHFSISESELYRSLFRLCIRY